MSRALIVGIALCACCAAAQQPSRLGQSGPASGGKSVTAELGRKQAPSQKPAARPARKEEATRDVASDPKAVELLRKMEERYGSVQTVAGRFSQVREDPAFQERVDSTAEFAIMKPNKFKAEYLPPRVSVNLINGEYSYQYVPELKQVNRYRFRPGNTVRDLNYMLLGFGAKTDELLKVYAAKWLTQGVAAGYQGVQLVPLDKENASFNFITILVTNDARMLPAQFSVGQKDGVRTTANLDVDRLRLDVSLSARDFEPSFPKNAEIVDVE